MTTNLRTLLATYVDPVNGLESTLIQLLTERSVDTASGVRLDVIGKLVGQARAGLGDEDYRRYVRARISTNKSNGTLGDIYRVSRLVVNDEDATIVADPQAPGAVVIRVDGIEVDGDLADILIGFLRDTVSAGVRAIVEYTSVAPSSTMHFDLDTLDEKSMATAID